MAFDIGNRVGRDAGICLRQPDRGRLPGDRGRGVGDLVGAVVVEPGAADHRVDVVAVAHRVVEAAQHHRAGAVREHGAGGVRVERPAGAIVGGEPAILGEVAAPLRKGDRHPAGERRVAGARTQVEHRLGDRGERGRAGGLHGHRRPLEVELVGDPRRQAIAQVARRLGEFAGLVVGGIGLDLAAVAEQVVDEVGIDRGAGKDPDRFVGMERVAAAVFQGFVADLEEHPRLRVGHRGLARVHRKEPGVEHARIRQPGPHGDVVRPGALFGREAVFQRVPLVGTDQVGAAPDVLPELRDRADAGQARRHADDGDGPRGKVCRQGRGAGGRCGGFCHGGGGGRLRRRAGRDDLGEPFGLRPQPRHFEQQGHVEPHAERLYQRGVDIDQLQRSAAGLEEGHVAGNRAAAEGLVPQPGDRALDGFRRDPGPRRGRGGRGRGGGRVFEARHQGPAVDLAIRGQREICDHEVDPGQHAVGQFFPERAHDVAGKGGGVRRHLARGLEEGGDAFLAGLRVGQHDGSVDEHRQRAQVVLDFVELDPPAAKLDLAVGAAVKLVDPVRAAAGEVAGQVDQAIVSGARVLDEGFRGALGLVEIAQRHPLAGGHELADLALAERGEVFVDDEAFAMRRGNADRNGAGAQVVAGDQVGRGEDRVLGRAIDVDEVDIRGGVQQTPGQGHRHHVAARPDLAKAGQRIEVMLNHQVDDAGVEQRHGHLVGPDLRGDDIEVGLGQGHHRQGGAVQQRRPDFPGGPVAGDGRIHETDVAGDRRPERLVEPQPRDCPVRQDHALGPAGRSRGVHDVARIFAAPLREGGPGARFPAQDVRDREQRGVLGGQRLGEISIGIVPENGRGLRILDVIVELLGIIGRVQRHIGGARAQDPCHGEDRLRRAVGDQRDVVAGLHALRHQVPGDAVGGLGHLGIAVAAPGADESGGIRGDVLRPQETGVEIQLGIEGEGPETVIHGRVLHRLPHLLYGRERAHPPVECVNARALPGSACPVFTTLVPDDHRRQPTPRAGGSAGETGKTRIFHCFPAGSGCLWPVGTWMGMAETMMVHTGGVAAITRLHNVAKPRQGPIVTKMGTIAVSFARCSGAGKDPETLFSGCPVGLSPGGSDAGACRRAGKNPHTDRREVH